MAPMRLRELEEYLQQLDGFEEPKIWLEQYSTSAHIGAHILHTAYTHFDDIEGKAVADLGAGCGVLSLGAQLLGASHVVGFEIDADALSILRSNCLELETDVEAVHCDLLSYLPGRFEKYFDTVVMNPPFGTKRNAGTDMKFLETAVSIARHAVYSLHKTSTRDHVLRTAKRLGTTAKVVAELRYDLPRAYKFHKNTSVDVQVDFIRLELD
ncbi:rRNA N6-adenosine-methyltransferase METTL5 isoform X1 [Neodiprion pinetum]|uniref:Methyltransferase-like protein 5 n=1 Tax=Neodiprion lecontei TaxID=441921 RepID=A0ABM3G5F3_NEOLC|nr:rRNA N6-adenosine-methyltransferase METTL5-like isoform X1 [Neodiprion fabricii]XP_046481198.1 rRNA N6-adenosine-methyltransferase METTL5-like isoform X1 [Neodiprion pinetum]XP_046595502.1 rRNA N6-adenosine-methyltransferase METTL5 isoform X1 [Neodiprion lecontei]XP_046621864.1 rRNA N6-adenosine-methyltransferase METTL5-like isoform X1 [Neodiprion virginianus]